MKARLRVPQAEEIRVENWNGYDIRFAYYDGEWLAVLKDVCDALELKTFKVSQRLDPEMMMRLRIDVCDIPSREVTSRARNTQDMLVVDEIGIYEALFASRRLEARKFRQWAGTVMKRLRQKVGLEGYEVMRMTEPEIQDTIDCILDSLYYDEEQDRIMQSVTVAGGDVEQVEFCG